MNGIKTRVWIYETSQKMSLTFSKFEKKGYSAITDHREKLPSFERYGNCFAPKFKEVWWLPARVLYNQRKNREVTDSINLSLNII